MNLACCLLALTFAFTITACDRIYKPIGNRVVLSVNGQDIKAKEFAQLLATRLKSYDALAVKDPITVDRAKQEVMREFIIKVLTEAWAKEQGLLLRREQLDQEIEKIRKGYPDDASFEKALADENLNFKQWRERIGYSLLQRMVMEQLHKKISPPTDVEVQSHYQSNKDNFKVNEQIQLRQIVLANESDARRVEEELKSGKKLKDLAEKFSISPEGKAGGDLGWIEKGTLEVFDQAFKLRVGARSNILKSSFGFHILEVLNRRGAQTKPLEDVAPQIRRSIMENREQGVYTAWLEEQIRKARVLKDEALLAQIRIETRD